MQKEIKEAIENLSASLEPLGIPKLKPKNVFESINVLIEKMATTQYTIEQRIPKITGHLVVKTFKLLEKTQDETVFKPIFAKITALVTQMISQPKPTIAISAPAPAETPAPVTPVRTAPVVEPAVPAPATPAATKGSQLFDVLFKTPMTKILQEAHQGSEDEASDDDDWAVEQKPRKSLSTYVPTQSTRASPEQRSPQKFKLSTTRRPVFNGYVPPTQLLKMVNVTSQNDIEKLTKIKEKNARVEAQLEAEQALEKRAVSAEPPKEKKAHSPHAPKTSAVTRKARPNRTKGDRTIGPLQEKIDFENIKAMTLRSNTAQIKATTIPIAQQQAPEAVEPLFSTSPAFIPDAALSPVSQASPIENINNPPSPAARHAPHPASPLVFSEFFSSANATDSSISTSPNTARPARLKRTSRLNSLPDTVDLDLPFIAPSPRTPRTPTTRHTPNAVSPAVVVTPVAAPLAQMEDTPVIQRHDAIEQPQQSPMVRQPDFLAINSPVLGFSPAANPRRLQQTPENVAVQQPVSGVKRKSMEPAPAVIPSYEPQSKRNNRR